MLRLALLLLVFLPITGLTQPVNQAHQRLLEGAYSANYPAAISELKRIRVEDPENFQAANYDYLLARILERSGDFAAAAESYQSVVRRNSVLKEYALWHLSRIVRASGNLTLERLHLEELIAFSSDSLLTGPARQRFARSWFESGNYVQAIRSVEAVYATSSPQTASKPKQPSRQDLAFLADAYYRSENREKARELFTRLLAELPNPGQPDDHALAGVKGLDLLDTGPENYVKTAPKLSDYEHLRRASVYQFNREFAAARLHYEAIINRHHESGIVPDAIYQIGRGQTQQGSFTEAVTWYERVLEQFPEHPVAKDALLQAASAYARTGKYRESVARYRSYIDKYPEDERLDRAYLNIVDVLRDSREESEALKWTMKIRETFKGKLPEVLAIFAEARIHIARGNWESALPVLERLQNFKDLGAASPGGTTHGEVTFLRGLALENMRRYQEAIDVYLSIPDGRNEYYGGRATEQLRQLWNIESARPLLQDKINLLTSTSAKDADIQRRNLQSAIRLTENLETRTRLIETLRKAYESLPAYRSPGSFKLLRFDRVKAAGPGEGSDQDRLLAGELLYLGLYDEAAPELEAARPREAGENASDFVYTLAVYYNRGNRADRATAFIARHWKMPADYQIELIPREVTELLYPVPYSDALLKNAPLRSVDPRFLLSIMRQESRFRADVKSDAAARGLMQFISTTATRIAAQVGRENFRQDDLYDPQTAILFGSQYLANLFDMFPNQPPAVAASYNGGEDNMKRWLARSRSDSPDRYIPEIAFAQSKDYVYRVMANYRMYKLLYDSNLKPR